MMKFHVPLTEEDVERGDAVRITWHRLQQRSLRWITIVTLWLFNPVSDKSCWII
jgi:hypothetical protein